MITRATNPCVSADRWTCPNISCGQTVVVDANRDDTRWLLRAAMERHGLMHRTITPREERRA